MGDIKSDLDALVRKRFDATKVQRQNSRLAVWRREPLSAEPDRSRAGNFASRMGAESIQGDSIDYLPSSFLALGAKRGRSVAIVRTGNGSPLGTGFLISPDLFITNNHVLETSGQAATALIEFNFENDEQALPVTGTRYSLAPQRFWHFNAIDKLDFAIVAVGERLSGADELAKFGFLPLSDRPDKHALGMAVNIVEHPQGRRKQVVVRENRLLARGGGAEHCLHYSADTEEGSSGSPVMNDAWEVVALHHWGVPHLDTVTVDGTAIPVTVNEGIRASAIVGQLRQDVATLSPMMQPLLKAALDLGENVSAGAAPELVPGTPPQGAHVLHLGGEAISTTAEGQMANESGSASQVILVPLEVSVRVATGLEGGTDPAGKTLALGSGAGRPSGLEFAERIQVDRNYGNRNGYAADFIEGLAVGLPDLVRGRVGEVAPLVDGSKGAKAVLDYQNFSIMMCSDRKMAFVSGANIDAKRYINIDRDTGEPKVGPEGETWFDDDRMESEHYIGQDFYGAWSTYFDRGHLTRRSDPTWGTPTQSKRGNADTYHRTNCTPQHFRFNESVRYWQGLERYILEFGVLKTKTRVTVLTGPVLDADNVSPCDNIDVPLLFWKVVLRVGPNGSPQASAYVVSQEKLLKEKRVAINPPSDEIVPKIDTFRFSVPALADLTGLDFSSFAQHDTYKATPGAEAAARPMTAWEDAL